MPAKIYSVSTIGLNCELIEVEADISTGLSSFKIVGLGDASVQESKERVRSAIKNSGCKFPITKKTINLAPAELRKQGSMFDLPIAVAVLAASKQIPRQVFSESIVVGELSLDGAVKGIKGILPIANYAKQKGFKKIFLPSVNKAEASLIDGIKIYGVETLTQLKNFCQGTAPLTPLESKGPNQKALEELFQTPHTDVSFSNIFGLESAKRALIIAAAGGHHTLLRGQPGTGKTILARAFSELLPKMSLEEAFEVTKIYSITEGIPPNTGILSMRPFREVHHTASKVAIIGGGSNLKPGEITLAHRGVLFMDELTEFPRATLETLRQPLEDGYVTISRARNTMRFPCEFILLAAMNNCPCGRLSNAATNTAKRRCKCTPKQILAYSRKLSDPLLDRFDIFVDTPQISIKNFLNVSPPDEEQEIKNRIALASAIQRERNGQLPNGQLPNNSFQNSKLSADAIKKTCNISPKAKELLDKAESRLGLSNRGYLKVIKVARTIADIDQQSKISEENILEAIQYRHKDNLKDNSSSNNGYRRTR